MAYTQIQKIENPNPIPVDRWGIRSVIDGYYILIAADANLDSDLYKRDINGVWKFQNSGIYKEGNQAYGNYLTVNNSAAWEAQIFNKDGFPTPLRTFDSSVFDASITINFGKSSAIADEFVAFGDYAYNSNRGAVFIYEKIGTDDWAADDNYALITPDISNENDYFGFSIATNGESIIVGAYGDNDGKGTVYIFQKNEDNGVWEQTQKLFASDGEANDRFGESVSASGEYFVAGASLKDSQNGDINSGAAYVFKYSDSWYEVNKLVGVDNRDSEGNHFGESVCINGDHIIVGSPAARSDRGMADIFYKKRSWGHLIKLLGEDSVAGDSFGTSVSISGRFATVGSPDYKSATIAGAVYVFEDPSVRLRLAQEFEVGSQYLPSKASVYLKRVGENTSNYWSIYNTSKTVIDTTNFSILSDPAFSDPSIDILSNTVAQYKMNDNIANTVVEDSLEYSNGTYNGENTSTRSVDGIINRALNFTGTPDYITTNDTFLSTFQDSFSINLWVKPDNGHPLANQFFCGTSGAGDDLFIYFKPTGDLIVSYTAIGSVTATFANAFIDGQETWHMITVVVEAVTAATARVLIYFDRVLEATGVTVLCNMSGYENTEELYFGADNNGGVASLFYDGDIDNISIHNKILSQDEIDFLYNSGSGTEDLSEYSNSITFEDTLGGFTGNGYMISKEFFGIYDYLTINYPVKAITPDTYNLWIRCININDDSFKAEILIDGNISKTISTFIDNPSDGLEWSWINTTIVLPDSREHVLGIRIKGNGVAIDKRYIEADSDVPYTEGPEYSVSPYLTAHMRVYDSLHGEPGSPLFIYDYKNSIAEIIQDDWYNFDIKVMDDTHGYNRANDFTENYYLVMSVTGSNTSNFIIWELVDNDEYEAPSSAIKF